MWRRVSLMRKFQAYFSPSFLERQLKRYDITFGQGYDSFSKLFRSQVFKDGVQFGEKVLTFNWQPQSLVLSTPKAVAAPVIVQTSPELDHNEAPSLAVAKETVEAVAAVMAEPDVSFS